MYYFGQTDLDLIHVYMSTGSKNPIAHRIVLKCGSHVSGMSGIFARNKVVNVKR